MFAWRASRRSRPTSSRPASTGSSRAEAGKTSPTKENRQAERPSTAQPPAKVAQDSPPSEVKDDGVPDKDSEVADPAMAYDIQKETESIAEKIEELKAAAVQEERYKEAQRLKEVCPFSTALHHSLAFVTPAASSAPR